MDKKTGSTKKNFNKYAVAIHNSRKSNICINLIAEQKGKEKNLFKP